MGQGGDQLIRQSPIKSRIVAYRRKAFQWKHGQCCPTHSSRILQSGRINAGYVLYLLDLSQKPQATPLDGANVFLGRAVISKRLSRILDPRGQRGVRHDAFAPQGSKGKTCL